MMLTAIGLSAMLLVVYALVKGKAAPLIVLTLIPIGAAALAGFNPQQIGEFANKGALSVAPIASLFIFAILFFSAVREAGIFEPLVQALLRFAGDRVVRVTVATSVVAMIAHLEGIGAATFLIAIPAFLPIYRRLHMSEYDLLLITGLSAGVVNFAPWGGPIGRAALAMHLNPVDLWTGLIPVELVGVVCALTVAFMVGKRAERNLALTTSGSISVDQPAVDAKASANGATHAEMRTGRVMYWCNVALTVGAIACLVFTRISPTIVFLCALAVALLLNFRTPQAQLAHIKRHAAEALTMGALMFAAGCFLGVMDGSGMLPRISAALTSLMPGFVGPYIHILIGSISLFIGALFSPDPFYLGLMPMVDGIARAHGIPSDSVARAMMIGESIGFSISPAVPTAYLAAGLAGCEIGEFMRRSLLTVWVVSLINGRSGGGVWNREGLAMSILHPISEDLSLTAALEPGKRTILCVPGTLISPRIFDAYVAKQGFQLAAVSWMTESGPWDIEGVASKIIALIDRLKLPKVFLIGHSAGGAICLSVALRRKIAGLVLSNTGANTATHGDPNYPQRILDSWGEAMRRAQVRRCFVKVPTAELLQMLDEYADRCTRDGVFAAATSLRRLDFAPSLAQIDCPVLLAFGRLDPVRTERDVETLKRGIADTTAVLLDAGHTPMLEAAHEWNNAVDSWISSIESKASTPR